MVNDGFTVDVKLMENQAGRNPLSDWVVQAAFLNDSRLCSLMIILANTSPTEDSGLCLTEADTVASFCLGINGFPRKNGERLSFTLWKTLMNVMTKQHHPSLTGWI